MFSYVLSSLYLLFGHVFLCCFAFVADVVLVLPTAKYVNQLFYFGERMTSLFQFLFLFFNNAHLLHVCPQSFTIVQQPVPTTNPFGLLPAMPQMSIGQGGIASSIQY